jgi:hypothetical protein
MWRLVMTETLIEQLETEESMFVQTAQGVESAGGTLTLRGITPSTLYFSDRPQRVVGHMTTADFVDLWGAGDNSFESDPPNAVLSFLEPGGEVPEDTVIVIEEPRLSDGELSLCDRGSRGSAAGADGTRHAVHRPLRTAAVAGLDMRGPPTRGAADAPTVLSHAMPRIPALSGRPRAQ